MTLSGGSITAGTIITAYSTGGTSTSSSISGTTLTIGGTVTSGFDVGQTITGTGILPGTVIMALGSGSGGAGTYTINNSQTIAAGTAINSISAGTIGTYTVNTSQTLASTSLTGTIQVYKLKGSSKFKVGDPVTVENVTGVTGYNVTSTPIVSIKNSPYSETPVEIDVSLNSFTGSNTSGAAIITGITNTGFLTIGQPVYGPAVPLGAFITALVVNTSITLNINITAANTSVTFYAPKTFIYTTGTTGQTSGLTMNVNTLTKHNLAPYDVVTITGMSPDCFNTTAVVETTPGTTTFTLRIRGEYTATLAASTNVVTLTKGTTRGMYVGQRLLKFSGAGAFGASTSTVYPAIQSITGTTTFTVGMANSTTVLNHATAGAISFNTADPNVNTTTTLTATTAASTTVTITAAPSGLNSGFSPTTPGAWNSGLYVGQAISGTGVAAGAVITQIGAAATTGTKTFVVSATGTASTGSNLTVTPSEFSALGTFLPAQSGQQTVKITGTTTGAGTISSTSVMYLGSKINISGAIGNGNYITYITSSAHGYEVGNSINITENTPSAYNGNVKVLEVPTTTSFVVYKTLPTKHKWTSGGKAHKVSYSTGAVNGNDIYSLVNSIKLSDVRPPSGSWITNTDQYISGQNLSIAANTSIRWLTLFSKSYDVTISSMAINVTTVGAGAKFFVGLYKMTAPNYRSGYLLTSNSASIDATTAAGFKIINLSNNITLEAGAVYGVYIINSVIGTAATAIASTGVIDSWAGWTPSSETIYSDVYISNNVGTSFYEADVATVLPIQPNLPTDIAKDYTNVSYLSNAFSSIYGTTGTSSALVYFKTI